MKKSFLVFILIALYSTAYCDDIVYIVIQNTDIQLGSSLLRTTTVREGEMVFFQGRIRGNPDNGNNRGYEIFVRTEREEEGWINPGHILLQDNQPLSNLVTSKNWIYSYYQEIILEQKRETVFKHEPFWRDQYRDYVGNDNHSYDTHWWEFFYPKNLNLQNNFATMNTLIVDFIDFATIKQDQNDISILLQVICAGKNVAHPQTYQDYLTSLFNEGEKYRLSFVIDGDYMDVFVNDNPTKICTLIGVDDYFVESIVGIVREGEAVDLSRIFWPRRADGSTDYYSPSVANVLEEAKQPEPIDFSVESADTENQLAAQNSAKTNAMSLWAWFAVIGGAVVVGGAVVFVVRRKK